MRSKDKEENLCYYWCPGAYHLIIFYSLGLKVDFSLRTGCSSISSEFSHTLTLSCIKMPAITTERHSALKFNETGLNTAETMKTTVMPEFLFNNTTSLSTTTSITTTTTTSTDTYYWVYAMLGVVCWIALIVGCGFAWTQLCKALYLSSDDNYGCSRRIQRNPGIAWLMNIKCFGFYLARGCCCFCDDTADNNNNSGRQTHSSSASNSNDSSFSTTNTETGCLSSPPPPYSVAIHMRRPSDLDQTDIEIVRSSSHPS